MRRIAAVAGKEDPPLPIVKTNPPHSARLRSNGVRAEKCCAGVSVIGNGARAASCHQSSSSTLADAGRPQQSPIAERRDHQRTRAALERPQRAQVAVVVVIVAEQHDRDRRQVVETHRRRADPARADERQRAGAFRVHRIGQQIAASASG